MSLSLVLFWNPTTWLAEKFLLSPRPWGSLNLRTVLHLSGQIFKNWIGTWRGVVLHHLVYGSWTQIWIMNMNYDDQVQASREYNHCPKTTNNLIARAAMIRIHNHSVYIHPRPAHTKHLLHEGASKLGHHKFLTIGHGHPIRVLPTVVIACFQWI